MRENTSGKPILYEIVAFSEDYRIMRLKESQFQYSQKEIEECYHLFKNENVTYLGLAEQC